MSCKRWFLTVHWDHIPKTTYMFFGLSLALHSAAIVKKSHPDVRINLVRKEMED